MQKQNCKLIQILLKIILLVFAGFIILLSVPRVSAQSQISGQLNVDSTWSRVVYLSIISNFEELNSMSNNMIIEKSKLDRNGRFLFRTDYLPAEYNLYRIHLAKKGSPPASLIIGGKDENHMFLIASKNSSFSIKQSPSSSLFGSVKIEGSHQNKLLQKIDKMVLFADTLNFNGITLKRELIENGLEEELRQFADTCSFSLVALYALYKSNFESNVKNNPDFYNRFIKKWSTENSSYFKTFRKSIPTQNSTSGYPFLYGVIGLFLGVVLTFFLFKREPFKRNPLLKLTVQERKILGFLESGKTNKEISDELNISLSTVKSHVNSIFSKLKIKSRKELLSFEK